MGIDDVHAAVAESGAITALEGASPAELAPFIAEIRHFWLLDHDYLTTPGRGSGWTYSDAADARQFGKTIVRSRGDIRARDQMLPAAPVVRLRGADALA